MQNNEKWRISENLSMLNDKFSWVLVFLFCIAVGTCSNGGNVGIEQELQKQNQLLEQLIEEQDGDLHVPER